MTRRLATICLMTMLMMGVCFSPVPAQSDEAANETLKGISAVYVLVEDLSDGAKILGLTKESIQTDVELKLRPAGLRVVTKNESVKIPGMPYVYVRVNVLNYAKAANIDVELDQNASLERNAEFTFGVTTWSDSSLISNPHAQDIREGVKDLMDRFLNAWLSVNPKK